ENGQLHILSGRLQNGLIGLYASGRKKPLRRDLNWLCCGLPRPLPEQSNNSLGCLAIAVWIVADLTAAICDFVCQEFGHIFDNRSLGSSDQPYGSGLDGFRALGRVAHDDDGVAKRW